MTGVDGRVGGIESLGLLGVHRLETVKNSRGDLASGFCPEAVLGGFQLRLKTVENGSGNGFLRPNRSFRRRVPDEAAFADATEAATEALDVDPNRRTL